MGCVRNNSFISVTSIFHLEFSWLSAQSIPSLYTGLSVQNFSINIWRVILYAVQARKWILYIYLYAAEKALFFYS